MCVYIYIYVFKVYCDAPARCICTNVCTYTDAYFHVCVYICICRIAIGSPLHGVCILCTNVYIYIQRHIPMCACVYIYSNAIGSSSCGTSILCTHMYIHIHTHFDSSVYISKGRWAALARCIPREKLFGILRVSNPATRKDLADRTWGGSGTNQKYHLVQS